MKTAAYQSVGSPDQFRQSDKKPPGFMTEAAFCSVTLLFIKLYSDATYEALTFMTVLIPIMAYFVFSILFKVIKFISLMHVEEVDEDDGILSPKQTKILMKVLLNLAAYFGTYSLCKELDLHIQQKMLATVNLMPAVTALQIAFLGTMIFNYQKRKEYAIAQGQGENLGFLGATGLTTIFNLLTQTATTFCAGGQCFTIYSNTISSNLAAFGCSVTSINTYLIPVCCCLLLYAIWSAYRIKREFCYKPFLMVLMGAALIVFDNFLFGEQLNLHNIPSWIGNGLLIVGVILSSRDQAKDQASPFDI